RTLGGRRCRTVYRVHAGGTGSFLDENSARKLAGHGPSRRFGICTTPAEFPYLKLKSRPPWLTRVISARPPFAMLTAHLVPSEIMVRASGKCAECHARTQYSVVHEYVMSVHARK